MSGTYVELEVSPESHAEIAYLLKNAGYDHCIMDNGGLNLSGIAITRKAARHSADHTTFKINGKEFVVATPCNGKISYMDVISIWTDGRLPREMMTCTWYDQDKHGCVSGATLSAGEKIALKNGMEFKLTSPPDKVGEG